MTGINEAVVVYTLKIRKPGASAKVNTADVSVRARHGEKGEEADADSLRVSKTLIRSETYREIDALDSAMRGYLRSQALPTRLAGGSYLVPLQLVEKIDAKLAERAVERADLVEKLMGEYPAIIEEARMRLRELFEARDFPAEAAFRAAFDLETRISAMPDPGTGLAKFSAALYKREAAKAEASMRAMVAEIRDGMRMAMHGLVSALVDQLQPGPDGSRKRIMASAFESLRTFVDEFGARNDKIGCDSELGALVTQARGILAGVKVEAVRASTTMRADLEQKVGELRATLGKLTTADGTLLRFAALEAEETAGGGDAGAVAVAETVTKMAQRIATVDLGETLEATAVEIAPAVDVETEAQNAVPTVAALLEKTPTHTTRGRWITPEGRQSMAEREREKLLVAAREKIAKGVPVARRAESLDAAQASADRMAARIGGVE